MPRAFLFSTKRYLAGKRSFKDTPQFLQCSNNDTDSTTTHFSACFFGTSKTQSDYSVLPALKRGYEHNCPDSPAGVVSVLLPEPLPKDSSPAVITSKSDGGFPSNIQKRQKRCDKNRQDVQSKGRRRCERAENDSDKCPPAEGKPDEEHVCEDCGKSYTTASNLTRHRQTHRSILDKKARKCPHCDRIYVSSPAFNMVRTTFCMLMLTPPNRPKEAVSTMTFHRPEWDIPYAPASRRNVKQVCLLIQGVQNGLEFLAHQTILEEKNDSSTYNIQIESIAKNRSEIDLGSLI